MSTSGSGLYVGGSVQAGWNHVAVVFNSSSVLMYLNGTQSSSTALNGQQAFTPNYNFYIGTQGPAIGSYYTGGTGNFSGNLADVRVSNVARYTGSTYVVPSQPFASNDANTLLLLKSLNQQTGTTLEVQGRGLNSTSIGAGRVVQSYPPAPMSSYLLDTTSNASVTYGQGKYVASASSDSYVGASNYAAWNAFGIIGAATAWVTPGTPYSGNPPYGPTTSTSTVDTIGNAYAGEWLQIQLPVSVLLTKYQLNPGNASLTTQVPAKWWVLGSRDGINWALVHAVSGWSGFANMTYSTFQMGATQAYNYYRLVVNQLIGAGTIAVVAGWILNGTEESLCITNDSKVGVGIANPQRSLEVAGDLVTGGTVSAGNPLMYRNRIINGDMRIAQRGTSNVVPSIAAEVVPYSTDRWCVDASITTGTLTQSQISLVSSDTPYQVGFQYANRLYCTTSLTTFAWYGFLQRIEGINALDLNWGTSFGQPVTVSFWFRTNMPAGSQVNVNIRSASYAISFNQNFTALGGGQWQYVTVTVPPPPNGSGGWSTYVSLFLGGGQPGSFTGISGWNGTNQWGIYGTYNWAQNAGNYVDFTGVQLEKGTIATPFEVRPYATELQLCQRYFETSFPQGTTPAQQLTAGSYSVAAVFNSGQLDFNVPFQVRKRVAPTTISLYRPATIASNVWGYVYAGTGWAPIPTPTTTAYETGMLLESIGGTATIGAAYLTGGNWAVSAEL